MTPAAIRDGFAQLRSDEAMLPLADAAVCRSEADWLVGINGTRAMTAFNSKSGGFQLTTVGRVQTPTLAILVEREEKIRAFRPRDYWEVVGTFRAAGRRIHGPLVRREVQARRRRSRFPRRTRVGRSASAGDCRQVRRQARHGQRGIETVDAKPAAALRPDEPAARGQRPVRLLGAHDAVARAGALREAQGADVSAHRRACAARGLHRHRQGDAGGIGRDQRLRRVRARNPEAEVGAAEQADLRQLEDLRSLRDHPDAVAAEASERDRDEALRSRRAALSRGVLSAGRAPADHAHHARRRRAVQDRRAHPRIPGLARRVRQGGARRRGVARAGAAEREGRDREDRRGAARHEAAAAAERGDAAVRDGRRRQAHRGRRLARGDAREGTRYAGDARSDHRRIDCGTLCPSRRQGAHADRQGVLADDAAARSRRARAVLAGAHRGVGVQARADGARQAGARHLHARDRRDDRAYRRSGQRLRKRHDSRRLRDALEPVPEMRDRRGAREIQEIPVHRIPSATSRSGKSWAGARSNRTRPTR